jgi:hyperosmotically inducible periplasmic protein
VKRMALGILAVFLLACLSSLSAQDSPPSQNRPDNTEVNKRDQQLSAPTADQQSEHTSDRDLARQIRRTIVKDDSLSTYAHNIKVIVKDGVVTLRGPVRSDEEKQAIEAKAVAIAGSRKVTNQLEVAPKQTN